MRLIDTCPHCGEPLPAVVDAFCSECRERLDEPPVIRDAAAGQDDRQPVSQQPFPIGILLLIAGVGATLLGLLALARGNWPEALYMGGPGIFLVAFGAWHSRQPKGQ